MPSYNPPRYLFRRYEILRNIKGGDSFLEIGAGNLKLSQELLKYFNTGYCVDFSEFIEQFHSALPANIKDRLHLHVGDFTELRLTQKFDCVVSCEVLEHIENDKAFLRSVHSILKDNGQLILSVPAKMQYWTLHDELVGHLRRYEKEDLIKIIQEQDFTSIRVISYGYPFLHILRHLRNFLAKFQEKEKRDWSQKKQTQVSGALHAPSIFRWSSILINKFVFWPLSQLSKLFNRFDFSDGYIVIAYKY